MYTLAMDERYTLEELARKTGFEARTIRNYIQRGLLRGPEAMGPNAYYVSYHLRRLEAIKLLKEFYGLKLGEVRQILLAHSEEDFDPRTLGLTPVMDTWVSAPHFGKSALEFIQSVKSRRLVPDRLTTRTWAADCLMEEWPRSHMEKTPLEQLLRALRAALQNKQARRATRGEPWVHMEVTPDIKVLARGNYTAEELAVLEQIADCMRQILLGGTSDDD